MSRISRLQRARTPPRRRSRAWFARQEARRWVWVLDCIEYTSGAAEGIDPWGRPMTCGWVAPAVIHLRKEMGGMSEHDGHYRTSDRVGVRGRKATCSCGWGHERGGWGPRGSADPRQNRYLAWLLQEAWRAHAGLPPCAELLPDGYDYWGGER